MSFVGAIFNRPERPESPLTLSLDTNSPRRLILGRTAVAGSFAFSSLSDDDRGDNRDLNQVIVLAGHRCRSLTGRIWADGAVARTGTLIHGVRTQINSFNDGGSSRPRLWITYYDGRSDQTSDSFLTSTFMRPYRWRSSDRLRGCAYVVVTMRRDDDVLPNQLEFLFEIEGAFLYDRRRDSTAGGNGTQRWNVPSTWTYSTNNAVAADHYQLGMVGGQNNDQIIFGMGLAEWQVPYDEFEANADICDETVFGIPRYAVNGTLSAEDDHRTNITILAESMAAKPYDTGGRIIIRPQQARPITITLTDSDIVSGTSMGLSASPGGEDLINTVRGEFSDPNALYEFQEYPTVADDDLISQDGREFEVTLDLPLETNPDRAQRVATIELEVQKRRETIKETFMPIANVLEVGDWFERVSELRGPVTKIYEVVDLSKNNSNLTVDIEAREIDPSITAFGADQARPVTSPEPLDRLEIQRPDPPASSPQMTQEQGGGAVRPVAEIVLTPEGGDTFDVVDYFEVEYGESNGLEGDDLGILLGREVLVRFANEGQQTLLLPDLLPTTTYAYRVRSVISVNATQFGEFQEFTTTSNLTSTDTARLGGQTAHSILGSINGNIENIQSNGQSVDQLVETFGSTASAAQSAALSAASASASQIAGQIATEAQSLSETAQAASEEVLSNVQGLESDAALSAIAAASSQELTVSLQQSVSARNIYVTTNGNNGVGGWSNTTTSTSIPSIAPVGDLSLSIGDSSEFPRFSNGTPSGRTLRVTGWYNSQLCTENSWLGVRAITTVGGNYAQRVSQPFLPGEDWTQFDNIRTLPEADIREWSGGVNVNVNTDRVRLYDIHLEDITESQSANDSAIASAASAASAAVSSTDAGQFATSTQQDRIAAETSASESSVSSNQAVASALDAAGQASAAAASAQASVNASVGRNLLQNTRFLQDVFWDIERNGDASADQQLFRESGIALPGERSYEVVRLSSSSTGFSNSRSENIQVEQGMYYTSSIYSGARRCRVELRIGWYSSDGTNLGLTNIDSNSINESELGGGSLLRTWKRLWVAAQAPANATSARVEARKLGTITGTNSTMFLTRPMFAEGHAEQTEPGPWSEGSNEAAVTTNIQAIADNTETSASLQIQVNSNAADVTTNTTAITTLDGSVASLNTSVATTNANVTVNAAAVQSLDDYAASSFTLALGSGGEASGVRIRNATTGAVTQSDFVLFADRLSHEVDGEVIWESDGTGLNVKRVLRFTGGGSVNNPNTMGVYGNGFGANSDLIFWFGPYSASVDSLTPQSGVRAMDTTGRTYLAGVDENASAIQASDTAAITAELTGIATNGNTQIITGSFAASGTRTYTQASQPASGTFTSGSATIAISRAVGSGAYGAPIETLNLTGSFTRTSVFDPDNLNWFVTEVFNMGGAVTNDSFTGTVGNNYRFRAQRTAFSVNADFNVLSFATISILEN